MLAPGRSSWLTLIFRRRYRLTLFVCLLAIALVGFSSLYTPSDGNFQHVQVPWLLYLDWSNTSGTPNASSNWSDLRISDYFGGRSRLAQHKWEPNGLLTVNPDAPHPIYELVRKAETRWAEKNALASRTIEEAVEEYKRRYGRPPPTGFDHWWDYAVKHDVRLPDEYDQIYRDLEPYWGIDPIDLQLYQRNWEGHRDSWTIGKDSPDAPVTVLNASLPDGMLVNFWKSQISPQLQLIGDLWKHIPPFRVVFSPHDAPNQRREWAWKSAALDAAKRGSFLKPEDLVPLERRGWASLCPPGSPMYANAPEIGSWPTPQSAKTFIYDHVASTDACQHPQYVLLHGMFLSADSDITPDRFPSPQFSYSPTSINSDIHAISLHATDVFLHDDTPWEEKTDGRLVWRGGPTGMWHVERPNITWRNSQRLRLVNLTSDRIRSGSSFDQSVDVVHFLSPNGGPDEPVGEPLSRYRSSVNRVMMDVGFASEYGNCEGVACEIIAEELGQKDHKAQDKMGSYKYLMDVDGNGWSGRFRRLMSSHSVVLKSTLFPEWFSERIQPWVHYVPVQIDYSDIYDVLAFFAGDMEKEGSHDEMARRIGVQGRDWVTNYWRREDMTAYMFRLYLEYARVMSPNRKSMNFELSPI